MTQVTRRPDHQALFDVASSQGGAFTTEQAAAFGFSRTLLSHHARSGRFERVTRGVYRFTQYPEGNAFERDLLELLLALQTPERPDAAVVSHMTALAVHDLADVIPDRYEVTIPRELRYLRPPAHLRGRVKIHTSTEPIPVDEIEIVLPSGVRATTAARTIVDVANVSAISPEQIEMAVQQSLQRARASRSEFTYALRHANKNARHWIERALANAAGRK